VKQHLVHRLQTLYRAMMMYESWHDDVWGILMSLRDCLLCAYILLDMMRVSSCKVHTSRLM